MSEASQPEINQAFKGGRVYTHGGYDYERTG